VQGLWYGDRRDRVKWGALIYLAHSRSIHHLIQVAYLRTGEPPILQTSDGDVNLPLEVWQHFSDLRQIQRLGETVRLKITVLDAPYSPDERRSYVLECVTQLTRIASPKIVFLDPDTGMAPQKMKAEHVSPEDASAFWTALTPKDMLVVYQHADHSKTWLRCRSKALSLACPGAAIQVVQGKGIASDIAMLWCEKS
jgi:hypothetical protein